MSQLERKNHQKVNENGIISRIMHYTDRIIHNFIFLKLYITHKILDKASSLF